MAKPPFRIHLINLIIKYLLFLFIFIAMNYLNLIKIEAAYIYLIPFIYTIIGVIADWTIVPRYHNIPSGLMGSIFMGATTYFFVNYLHLGNVTFYSAVLLALLLGSVEIILHYFIVKPFIT